MDSPKRLVRFRDRSGGSKHREIYGLPERWLTRDYIGPLPVTSFDSREIPESFKAIEKIWLRRLMRVPSGPLFTPVEGDDGEWFDVVYLQQGAQL